MNKEYKLKKQIIQSKIRSKLAHIEPQPLPTPPFNFSSRSQIPSKKPQPPCLHPSLSPPPSTSSSPPNQPEKPQSPTEQASQSYKKATLQFYQYVTLYRNKDSEYTHKLLFDYFKAQAIWENMQEDSGNQDIYGRFLESQERRIRDLAKEEPKVKQEDGEKGSGKLEPGKKMTMQDKLRAGKFCQFDYIPEYGEIEEYKSISSEEEILDQDCLEDLIKKVKKGKKHNSKPRNRKKSKQPTQNQRITLEQSSQNPKKCPSFPPLTFHPSLHSPKMTITYPVHSNRSKSRKDEEDSLDQVNFDSQESEASEESFQEEEDSDDMNEEDTDMNMGLELENVQNWELFQDEFQDQGDFYQELSYGCRNGKDMKINPAEEYQSLSKPQKLKYFRKLTKDYEHNIRKFKQFKKKSNTESEKPKKKRNQPQVTFSNTICFKNFDSEGKPAQIRFIEEQEVVRIKAIWEYDE